MNLKFCLNLLGSTLLFSVGIIEVVNAGYNPPPKPSAPSSPTTTTGRRGNCTGNLDKALIALAPHQHIGQTSTTRPTFTWFVPDTVPKPLKFRLYQVSPTGQRLPLHQVEMQSSLGIMQWKVPEDRPGLTVGQRYHWQVILVCNPNRPSAALVAGADLKVIPKRGNLERQLRATTNPRERAELYAEAGQWYDALAEVTYDSEGAALSAFTTQLLKQLADLESHSEAALANERSQQLREIAGYNGKGES